MKMVVSNREAFINWNDHFVGGREVGMMRQTMFELQSSSQDLLVINRFYSSDLLIC